MPIPVDSNQLTIKFYGLNFDQAIAALLSSYPSITFDPEDQPEVEEFALIGLNNADEYDSLATSLLAEEYVSHVNPVAHFVDTFPAYIGQTFICRFYQGTSEAEIQALADQYSLEIIGENEYMPGEYFFQVTAQCPYSVIDMANLFYELPETQYSHPNFHRIIAFDGYPVADEYYNQNQTNVKKVVGYSDGNNPAWEITTGDTSIYIGVMDQGIEPHEDFDTSKFWYGYDFVGTSGITYYPLPTDTDEVHGMSVLGLLSADHNNPVQGIIIDDPGMFASIAGMAPKCRIFDCRVGSKQYSPIDDIQLGIAIGFTFRNGADVINCSWTWIGGYADNIENAIDSAFTYGREGRGTLMVFSSGNFDPWFDHYTIRWPKTKDNVLTVGAIDNSDYWYDYSCYGTTLDLVAPSGEGYIEGQPYLGDGVWSADRMYDMGENPLYYDDCQPINDVDYRCTFGGTSAAAPLVTGTAALILSKRPELTAAQLMDVLKQSAVTNLDWGSITTPDEKYGYGRVNAFRALVAVARGDANNSGLIEVSDAVYLINYIFKDGPEPVPHYLMGDFNCDGAVNVGDAVSVISYVFRGGPAPEVCTDHLP